MAQIFRASISKVKNWYERYERLVSSLSLVGGFIFDAFFLKRVDLFIENFWIVIHLLMAGVGIILLNLLEHSNAKNKLSDIARSRIHFWLIIFVQGAFGGLLSTFLVFYFRSATLATSWIFFALLIAAFVANELLKHHYTRLNFQISMLFLSIYSFSIFIVPVIVHRIGPDIFILSGLLSLGVLAGFLFLLKTFSREHFTHGRRLLRYSIGGIVLAINLLYFLNIIPPIPISLKDAGVYHAVTRNTAGEYILTGELTHLMNYFRLYDPIHVVAGESLYAFSSVFAPTNFDTQIVHTWQYYDEQKHVWTTASKIILPIVGGRDGGYRTYSTKSALSPGKWRVNVETNRGQDIGRIRFIVEPTNQQAPVATTTH